MSAAEDWYALRAALQVQLDAGADEAILDAPVDRFTLPEPDRAPPPPSPAPTPQAPAIAEAPAVDTAALAQGCQTLDELRAVMEAFEGCALKKGARNFVFCDGQAGAPLMVIGEAPGAEEDRQGKPFVGPSGQLLDKMLAAIGLSRGAEDLTKAAYITNVIPWRPPANRDPSSDEVTMMRPFLMRHIQLARPNALLLLGNPSMKTVLQTKDGITRMRGTWAEVEGIPALPSFHPAALLRDPTKKRFAWADLLALKARLDQA
jgi:uracil-DNA glycosylase family 4